MCIYKNSYGGEYEDNFGAITQRVETCPEYDRVYGYGYGIKCYVADEKKPDCDCPVGNPVRIASKEKIQVENDYSGPHGLEFSRYFSSRVRGATWRHTYWRHLTTTWQVYKDGVEYPPLVYRWDPVLKRWLSDDGRPETSPLLYWTTITGTDGYGYAFKSSNGTTWTAEADVNASLTVVQLPDGTISEWRMKTPAGDTEIYDQAGALNAIHFRDGRTHTLARTEIAAGPDGVAGVETTVTDSFGRTLTLRGKAGQLTSMTDPAGNIYSYSYNPVHGLLDGVTRPDGLKRLYHFNEPEHVTAGGIGMHYLTGISDEISAGNIVRFGTYKWANKLPASTEHAGGVYKFVFDFSANKVTDPLGAVKTYGFTNQNGRIFQNSITQPDGRGGLFTISKSFDANGNVRVSRDNNNVPTLHDYDLIRNLEYKRVEAYGKPTARTISTQWHPTFRLPVDIAAPLLRTKMTYDDKGRLTSKSEQATTDASGTAGFGAPLVGKLRTWSYTYTEFGLLKTKRGPRTDINDTTTYDYDAAGNLTSITNSANHVITLSEYDANGRPGRITDVNNLQTVLTYHPRGWLTSSKTGSELTSYEYDGVGHVKRVSRPDGVVLNYEYDPAQRLTGITDNLGNSVSYGLDNAGNRTSEVTRDPDGALSRQITRVFDVRSRVKQVTGAAQ